MLATQENQQRFTADTIREVPHDASMGVLILPLGHIAKIKPAPVPCSISLLKEVRRYSTLVYRGLSPRPHEWSTAWSAAFVAGVKLSSLSPHTGSLAYVGTYQASDTSVTSTRAACRSVRGPYMHTDICQAAVMQIVSEDD